MQNKVIFVSVTSIPPVDTERKVDVHKTFNLRPVSTGANCLID